jgi:multiple sugar transport system substrate-binding protein
MTAHQLRPRPVDTPPCDLTRRRLLQLGLGAALTFPALSACAGFDTSGAVAGKGTVSWLSTQFGPVEERQRYERVLSENLADVPVAYNPVDAGVFGSTLRSQTEAGAVKVSLVGGLNGDLAPLADVLDPVDTLLTDLANAGIPRNILELTRFGGGTPKYVPWMQATYIVAVHKSALAWLPGGVDVNNLTYDGYLAWAKAAKAANGKPVFGFPAGPKGLHHRFYQGFLLPSFTGGQITTFRNDEAVGAWEYMRELWDSMVPGSTNYDFMQEPLASGEVLVAWDHVARLVGAPQDKPDDWLMVPAPRAKYGLGYLLIVAGVALPKGGTERDRAEQAIRALSRPATQVATLKENAFFPVVRADLTDDLSGAISLEAEAVRAQQNAKDTLLALPPVGLGAKDGEVSQIFKNCFQQICLEDQPVRQVLDTQAKQLNTILAGLKVPCWAPDPAESGQTCEVL